MKKENCYGCYNDFYNGKNELDIKECWHLESAKLIMRKEVHINQRPPWTQNAIRKPNCYRKQGFVYVGPTQIN